MNQMDGRHDMDITTLHELQSLVRARRTELQLTQAELAARAKVSRKWVSEFELDKVNPELPTVFRVLQALGLRIDVTSSAGDKATYERTGPDAIDLDELMRGHLDR